MDPRRLLDEEAEAWERFSAVAGSIPHERAGEPTVTPDGWSPKDTLFHVAAWLELCADVCEQISAGTWDPATAEEETPAFVDRINAEQFARARAMTPQEVEVRLARARERARDAFAAIPTVTTDAWGWFEESGPMHYAKHLHDLTAFAAGTTSDPEVGPLLQAETDAWLELVAAIEAVPDGAWDDPGTDGWAPRDALHHLVRWLDIAGAAVAENRTWFAGGGPAPDHVVDEMNERLLAEAPSADVRTLREELGRVRTRMREGLANLVSPSAEAKRSFRRNTVEHYPEHLGTFRGAATGRP